METIIVLVSVVGHRSMRQTKIPTDILESRNIHSSLEHRLIGYSAADIHGNTFFLQQRYFLLVFILLVVDDIYFSFSLTVSREEWKHDSLRDHVTKNCVPRQRVYKFCPHFSYTVNSIINNGSIKESLQGDVWGVKSKIHRGRSTWLKEMAH